MANWLVFGAGGSGVGAIVARQALARAERVTALVRNADAAQRLTQLGAQVIIGDACDAEAVSAACSLASASACVISTMGGAQDYLAHRTLIDCAERAGLTRMVLVTSLGCGDSWRFLSPRGRAAFGQAVREKSLAESWLQTSTLDFAILRPGGLLNGAGTGLAECSQNKEVHGFVMRADVATHVFELAAAPALNRQIYALIQPDLKPA